MSTKGQHQNKRCVWSKGSKEQCREPTGRKSSFTSLTSDREWYRDVKELQTSNAKETAKQYTWAEKRLLKNKKHQWPMCLKTFTLPKSSRKCQWELQNGYTNGPANSYWEAVIIHAGGNQCGGFSKLKTVLHLDPTISPLGTYPEHFIPCQRHVCTLASIATLLTTAEKQSIVLQRQVDG